MSASNAAEKPSDANNSALSTEKVLEPWHFCGPCFDSDHDACTGHCERSSECGRTCECGDNDHDEERLGYIDVS